MEAIKELLAEINNWNAWLRKSADMGLGSDTETFAFALRVRKLGARALRESSNPPPELPYLYLGSPYTHPRPEVELYRFNTVCNLAAMLIQEHINVFAPIAHGHAIATSVGGMSEGKHWEHHNKALLFHSKGLIIACLHGWETSKGLKRESAWANDFNLPVYKLHPEKGIDIFAKQIRGELSP
jgi:hypothetical protein